MLGELKVDCRESRDLMSGAVDNQLFRDESKGFYDHIEICGSCRDEYELERLTKAYLKRKITFVDVPYDVEQAIMAQFSTAVQEEKKMGFISKSMGNSIFQPVIALGIVVFVGVVLFFANKPNVIMPVAEVVPGSEKTVQQDALSLAETNFQDVLNGTFKPQITAIILSDVASYINQNAGYSVSLPPVASADWIGGTVSNYNGNKMAQVVYKIGEAYIYICSFPKDAVSSKSISFPANCATAMEKTGWFWGENSNGDIQAAWSNSDHVCIATSNLDKGDLMAYLRPPNSDGEGKP